MERERIILHCDLNSFYASVECLYHPEVRGKPVAVGGEVEKRHGIILTKNQEAKKYGIQVGEALWQAKQKCPNLIIFPPRYDLYLRYSELVSEIFSDYTDKIEHFGIDEAWLDVTESTKLFGNGKQIADTIRNRIYEEVGITASVGVSYNKIFAKLGSDYKKPNATTVITKENLEEIVFPLPVSDLLFVGGHTTIALNENGIFTIGDLAKTDPNFLKSRFGKNGVLLWKFANGYVDDPVKAYDELNPVKSIGNGVTSQRDLYNFFDVKMVAYILSESVASRLRDQNFVGDVVNIYIRDSHLSSFTRQRKLPYYTNCASEIAKEALLLFSENVTDNYPLRSIGITMSHLKKESSQVQLSLFESQEEKEKQLRLERTIDVIREKYGAKKIGRTLLKVDEKLTGFYPKEEHVIHPNSYYQ